MYPNSAREPHVPQQRSAEPDPVPGALGTASSRIRFREVWTRDNLGRVGTARLIDHMHTVGRVVF